MRCIVNEIMGNVHTHCHVVSAAAATCESSIDARFVDARQLAEVIDVVVYDFEIGCYSRHRIFVSTTQPNSTATQVINIVAQHSMILTAIDYNTCFGDVAHRATSYQVVLASINLNSVRHIFFHRDTFELYIRCVRHLNKCYIDIGNP